MGWWRDVFCRSQRSPVSPHAPPQPSARGQRRWHDFLDPTCTPRFVSYFCLCGGVGWADDGVFSLRAWMGAVGGNCDALYDRGMCVCLFSRRRTARWGLPDAGITISQPHAALRLFVLQSSTILMSRTATRNCLAVAAASLSTAARRRLPGPSTCALDDTGRTRVFVVMGM